jgi:hypothetical protein
MSDTDAFHMLKGLRTQGHYITLSVGVLHIDSPARLLKSVDVVIDGPPGEKEFIEYLVDNWPRFTSAK